MSKQFLAIALGIIGVGVLSLAPPDLTAQASDPVALSGVVSSQQEGLMEGVVVSARRDGANFTVSVVSDAKGKYSFPRSHVDPGKYALTIRAVGYDLIGPGAVTISEGKTTNAGSQARQDQGPRRAAQFPRVGHERPRHGRTEEQGHLSSSELRLLPCFGTRHEVEPHGR